MCEKTQNDKIEERAFERFGAGAEHPLLRVRNVLEHAINRSGVAFTTGSGFDLGGADLWFMHGQREYFVKITEKPRGLGEIHDRDGYAAAAPKIFGDMSAAKVRKSDVAERDRTMRDTLSPAGQESAAAFYARVGDDAAKWTDEFLKIACKLGVTGLDRGWMIGWFANAIEQTKVLEAKRRAEEDARERESLAYRIEDIENRLRYFQRRIWGSFDVEKGPTIKAELEQLFQGSLSRHRRTRDIAEVVDDAHGKRLAAIEANIQDIRKVAEGDRIEFRRAIEDIRTAIADRFRGFQSLLDKRENTVQRVDAQSRETCERLEKVRAMIVPEGEQYSGPPLVQEMQAMRKWGGVVNETNALAAAKFVELEAEGKAIRELNAQTARRVTEVEESVQGVVNETGRAIKGAHDRLDAIAKRNAPVAHTVDGRPENSADF